MPPNNNPTPVWFITGCSTGFGLEIAKLVLAHSWRAVLTARMEKPPSGPSNSDDSGTHMNVKFTLPSQQIIVLTGATSGIGLVTARMAAKSGARLVLAVRGSDSSGQHHPTNSTEKNSL